MKTNTNSKKVIVIKDDRGNFATGGSHQYSYGYCTGICDDFQYCTHSKREWAEKTMNYIASQISVPRTFHVEEVDLDTIPMGEYHVDITPRPIETRYIIQDSNGNLTDENGISYSKNWDLTDDVWCYMSRHDTYIISLYTCLERAEKALEYINKMNTLAGFNITFSILEKGIDYNESIPQGVSSYISKPFAKGYKTTHKKLAREYYKEHKAYKESLRPKI